MKFEIADGLRQGLPFIVHLCSWKRMQMRLRTILTVGVQGRLWASATAQGPKLRAVINRPFIFLSPLLSTSPFSILSPL